MNYFHFSRFANILIILSALHSDPGGEFAFFVGLDGKSLWRVAKDGASLQWVNEGEGFFYLP